MAGAEGRGGVRQLPMRPPNLDQYLPTHHMHLLFSYTTPTTPTTAITPILHVPPRVPTILTRILRLHTRRHRAPTSPSVRPRTDLAFPQSMSAIRISRAAEYSFTTTTNQPKSWLMKIKQWSFRVVARDFRCPNANICKEVVFRFPCYLVPKTIPDSRTFSPSQKSDRQVSVE